jgi:hypothetical protein
MISGILFSIPGLKSGAIVTGIFYIRTKVRSLIFFQYELRIISTALVLSGLWAKFQVFERKSAH